MTTALTHICLLVEDVQRALHFYQDTLGLEVLNNYGVYVELRANENLSLALFARQSMQEVLPSVQISQVSGHRAYIEFHIDKLDDFCNTLRSKGVQFVSELTDRPDWGIRTTYLTDPDGNLVELYRGLQET